MSNVEKKVLEVNLFSLGKFQLECKRINAPLTIQNIMKALPIKGRALKQGDRLIMPTELNVRPEKPKKDFKKGDVSIDPSSGNISFHLDNTRNLAKGENLIGSFTGDIETKGMPISTGVLIKEAVI